MRQILQECNMKSVNMIPMIISEDREDPMMYGGTRRTDDYPEGGHGGVDATSDMINDDDDLDSLLNLPCARATLEVKQTMMTVIKANEEDSEDAKEETTTCNIVPVALDRILVKNLFNEELVETITVGTSVKDTNEMLVFNLLQMNIKSLYVMLK